MSKITLTGPTSFQNDATAVTATANNNTAITNAIENTVSRDGTSPNQMLSTLDMNSNHIINLPSPSSANDPIRFQDLTTLQAGGTVVTLPVGGTTGQSLQKNSSANYDVKWGGNVTSVGLSLPADFTVTGSPVTTTGTLTATLANIPTGTGGFVRQTSPTITSPTLTTPVLGTPSSGTLTSCTGLPLTTGVTGILPAANGGTGRSASSVGLWIGRQIFTSTGTYTPTAGTNSILVRIVGGGGGGGGAAATAAGQVAAGSGGGAGGYSEARITSAFSGVTVTIGAAGAGGTAGANPGTVGGNSSLGAILTANGGQAGNGGTAATPGGTVSGVAGGTASGGDLNINGQSSLGSIYLSTAAIQSGSGGNSMLGSGGTGITTQTTSAGNGAGGKGAGGSGGANTASQSAVAGGAGTIGLCIIDEYA